MAQPILEVQDLSVEFATREGPVRAVNHASLALASGEIVAIDHFGASASAKVVFEQFGFTPDRVVAAAHLSLERVGAIRGATTGT